MGSHVHTPLPSLRKQGTRASDGARQLWVPAFAGTTSTSKWRRSRSCSASGRPRTRATLKTPITIEDALNSLMIANPVPLIAVLPGDRWWRRGDPRCRRAGSRLPAKACPWPEQGPVYLLGTGESVETPMVSSPVIPAESGNPGPQGFEPSARTPLFAGGDDNAARRRGSLHCRA